MFTSNSITLNADAVTLSATGAIGSLILSTATPTTVTKPNAWVKTGASEVGRLVLTASD